MLHKSMLGLPMLLLAASCVPPVLAGQRAGRLAPAAASVRAAAATPGFTSLGLSLAEEEPPALPVLAEAIAPRGEAKPFDISAASRDDVRGALSCLTAAVYYEARSEGESGQRAVAQVVLNRVGHDAFPKTVCGVVYQGSNRSTGCQFSFTCDGSLRRAREGWAWARAERVAAAALGGYVYGPVGLATHFHTTAIHPWWADSLARAVTIGSHVFYRWNGRWGDPRSSQRPYVGGEAFAGAGGRSGRAWPAAPARRTETVAGVVIHRGAPVGVTLARAEDGAVVRIHRSNAGPAPAAAVGEVRIHRGGEVGDDPPLAVPGSGAADILGTR
jgi:cell wall hydrolase